LFFEQDHEESDQQMIARERRFRNYIIEYLNGSQNDLQNIEEKNVISQNSNSEINSSNK